MISHFITYVLSPLSDTSLIYSDSIPLLALFSGALTNQLDLTMTRTMNTSGRVEITLFSGPSCVVLVGELKSKSDLDESAVLAQMLCECDGLCHSPVFLLTG